VDVREDGMGKKTINAWEVCRDILGGMADDALMTKYRLSREGLGHLFEVLVHSGLLERVGDGYAAPPKKRIITEDIVKDIRSGMGDEELMEKYDLTRLLLEVTQKQLLDRKFISRRDLDNRNLASLSSVSLFSVRQAPRYSFPFTVTISGEGNRPEKGRVLDISVKGLRTVGLEAREGRTETLTIHGDDFGELGTFQVTGTCRWTKAAAGGKLLAGFEIVEMPTGSRQELLHWIRMCTI
jgi:hypothetical protein